jgi:hypothetical protein
MSAYQRYRSIYRPRVVQTMNINSFRTNGSRTLFRSRFGVHNPRVSMKFFNFFMKFRLDRLDRRDEFYWKTQKIVIGPKSLNLDLYKTEQLRWITDTEAQRRIYNPSLFVHECRRRIRYFLDLLDYHAINHVDLEHVNDEGYKVTIHSNLQPRTRPQVVPISTPVPDHHVQVATLLLQLLQNRG